jgi:hypothetical protein
VVPMKIIVGKPWICEHPTAPSTTTSVKPGTGRKQVQHRPKQLVQHKSLWSPDAW